MKMMKKTWSQKLISDLSKLAGDPEWRLFNSCGTFSVARFESVDRYAVDVVIRAGLPPMPISTGFARIEIDERGWHVTVFGDGKDAPEGCDPR